MVIGSRQEMEFLIEVLSWDVCEMWDEQRWNEEMEDT
jgi:hypothetical protein